METKKDKVLFSLLMAFALVLARRVREYGFAKDVFLNDFLLDFVFAVVICIIVLSLFSNGKKT